MEVPTNTMPGSTGTWEAFYGTNGYESVGVLNAPNSGIAFGSGTTLAKTTYRIPLPPNINPGLFAVRFLVTTGAATSGTLTMKVYDVHLEMIE
jgi:phage repressor protein C with HTH and peptisase S24 domain